MTVNSLYYAKNIFTINLHKDVIDENDMFTKESDHEKKLG